MRFNPDHIEVQAFPKRARQGMQTGMISNGIRLFHTPTGTAVEISYHRSQHKNKEAALAVMERLIDDA